MLPEGFPFHQFIISHFILSVKLGRPFSTSYRITQNVIFYGHLMFTDKAPMRFEVYKFIQTNFVQTKVRQTVISPTGATETMLQNNMLFPFNEGLNPRSHPNFEPRCLFYHFIR